MAIRKRRKLSKKEAKAQKKSADFLANQNNKIEPQYTEVSKSAKKIVEIPETILVRELASKISVPVTTLIKVLMKNGVLKNINESLDWETAAIAGDELGYDVKLKTENEKVKTIQKEEKIDKKNLKTRPPIVTVMGHVDHGKTALLDAIRKTNVVSTESGGITQHIGAYQISFKNKKITFIDTPGHEAFEAMRAHGANITDIVVLVVAADDGIKPQTEEAYEHAKRAGVPIIVAINKIDLPAANIFKVKQQLCEMGLVPEDMGGKTITVSLSAKQNMHIDELLEMLLLVSEMKNFQATPSKPASAIVIESHLDAQLGPTAHILIQDGTLSEGDFVVVGDTWGRIRLMEDEMKKRLKQAGPSQPVKIAGIKKMPSYGEILQEVPDEKTCRKVLSDMKKVSKVISAEKSEGLKVLPLVLKSDVSGSLKAIKDSLKKLETDEVKIEIVREGTGDVTEDDIMMAKTSNARLLSFKTGVASNVKDIIEKEKISIAQYSVIYDLINDIAEIIRFLSRKEVEVKTGRAQVIKIFRSTKDEKIIGLKILSGEIESGERVLISHGDESMGEGKVVSLQIETKKVEKLKENQIGGIKLNTTAILQETDELIFYKKELK